jgi:hypothetical protein
MLEALIRELAAVHGTAINYASIARGLGLSRYRLLQLVERLERVGAVRLLPSSGAQRGKRAVQGPVIYLRQPCPLVPALVLPPQLVFRSAMIEHLLPRERARCPESKAGHGCTRAAAHAALVLRTPRANVGFQFPEERFPGKRRWTGLKKCVRAKTLDFGFVLYPGDRVFFAARKVIAVPAGDFLEGYSAWMQVAEEPRSWRVHEMAQALNVFAFRR